MRNIIILRSPGHRSFYTPSPRLFSTMTQSLNPHLPVRSLPRENFVSSRRNVFEITHTYRNRCHTTAEAVHAAYINDKSDERQLTTPRVNQPPLNQLKYESNYSRQPGSLTHTPHRPSHSQNAFEIPHAKMQASRSNNPGFGQQQPSFPLFKQNAADQQSSLSLRPHPVRSGCLLEQHHNHSIYPPYAMPSHPPLYHEYPDQIHSANLLQQSLPPDDQSGRRKKIDWGLINPNLDSNDHIRKCDLRGEQGVYQTGFNIFTRQFQPLIERQFCFPNKRVHQKLLGIIWKNLSEEEQKSYKERAITVRAVGFNSERKALNDPLFKNLTQNILRIISHKKRIAQFFRGHKRYHPIDKLEHQSAEDARNFKKYEKQQKRKAIQFFQTKKSAIRNFEEESVGEGPIRRRIPQNPEHYQIKFEKGKESFLRALKRQIKREEKQVFKHEKKVHNLETKIQRSLLYMFQTLEQDEDYHPGLLSLDSLSMKNRQFSRQPSFKEPLPLSIQEIRQRGIHRGIRDTSDSFVKISENEHKIVISPGLERLRKELSPIAKVGKYPQSAFSPHVRENAIECQTSYNQALRTSPYLNKHSHLTNSPYGYVKKRPQDLFHSLSNREFQTLENFEPKERPIESRVPYFNRREFQSSVGSDTRSGEL